MTLCTCVTLITPFIFMYSAMNQVSAISTIPLLPRHGPGYYLFNSSVALRLHAPFALVDLRHLLHPLVTIITTCPIDVSYLNASHHVIGRSCWQ